MYGSDDSDGDSDKFQNSFILYALNNNNQTQLVMIAFGCCFYMYYHTCF